MATRSRVEVTPETAKQLHTVLAKWRQDPRTENPLWPAACWAAAAFEAERGGLTQAAERLAARALDEMPSTPKYARNHAPLATLSLVPKAWTATQAEHEVLPGSWRTR
jgi:hypothetical protein